VKLEDTRGASDVAGAEVTPKDALGAVAGGATLLFLGVELIPAVATPGPAGDFHLEPSEDAPAALASRVISSSSPGDGERLA
jgi:hypothetical protein